MSSWRRSTRTQGRRPRYGEDHEDQFDVGIQQPALDMNFMMGAGGSWQTAGHHVVPTDAHHNYYMMGNQFPLYSHGETSQYVDNDQDPAPSSSRTLRTRATNDRGRKGRTTSASKASISNLASNIGGHSAEFEADDVEDDDAGQIEGSSGTVKSKKSSGVDGALTLEQLVQNCLYYMLYTQHKKVPVKRSDLIKIAMNSQSAQFTEVMTKLETVLEEVFGMKLVRLVKKGTTAAGAHEDMEVDRAGLGGRQEIDNVNHAEKKAKGKRSGSAATYIVVSKFSSNVCHEVARQDVEVDNKKVVLYLVLATIFMLNRPIDEEMIWTILQEMELYKVVCSNKEDLRKFLKSEFVSSGYLNLESTEHLAPSGHPKRTQQQESSNDLSDEHIGVRYTWGPRADIEYSKEHMLKFVANRFKKRPFEFTVQYNMLKKDRPKSLDGNLLDEDDGDGENHDLNNSDGDNGSALRTGRRIASKSSAYLLDGENTETETELEGVESPC